MNHNKIPVEIINYAETESTRNKLPTSVDFDVPSNAVPFDAESAVAVQVIDEEIASLIEATSSPSDDHNELHELEEQNEASEEDGTDASENHEPGIESAAPNKKRLKARKLVVAAVVGEDDRVIDADDDSVAAAVLMTDEVVADGEVVDADADADADVYASADAKVSLARETEEEDSEEDSEEAAMPEEVANIDSPRKNQFASLALHPAVLKAIVQSGYLIPTPIQRETIPHVLAGRDIIGKAETGSGKTAAFACPLLSNIDFSVQKPQILVLAPTRELAIQVTESFQKYGNDLPGFRAVTIYGGQSYEIQNRQIRRGVQVVVGTPGRIMDHLRQRTLDLSQLKTIVLDEADEMLRMGFIDDVEWILTQIPGSRQTLLFSATMPQPIQRIAQNYLTDPITISIASQSATADSITQSCVLVQVRQKVEMLAQILDSEPTDAVIVFVKTRDTTVVVADKLSERGISAAPLNGDIAQNQRERTVEQLKSGRLNVLVATDVAARGLDVQRISHVINFDFPHDTEAYIHRIGRTGRAGREGKAILFVEPKEQGKLKRLQRETNQPIKEYRPRSIKQVNESRVDRFKERITEVLESEPKQFEQFAEIVTQFQSQHEIPMEKLATALAILAQGDTPLFLNELIKGRNQFKDDNQNGGKRYEGEMSTFRVEVGRAHGVKPGNIVGAITNEADLNYASIGRIKLHDDFSLIDLPTSVSSETLESLQAVSVCGRQLRISPDRGGQGGQGGRGERQTGRRPYSGDRPEREGKFSNKSSGRSFSGSVSRPSRPSRPAGGERSGSDYRPKPEYRPNSDRAGSDRASSDRPSSDRASSGRPSSAIGSRFEKKTDRAPRDGAAPRREKSFGGDFNRSERSGSSERREYSKKPRSSGGFGDPKKGKPDRFSSSDAPAHGRRNKSDAPTEAKSVSKGPAKSAPKGKLNKFIKIRG